MQEFKVGDKVLVETEITNIFDGRYNLKTTYRGASICMMEMQANKVYPLSAGKTYEDGMAEAWGVARKLCAPEDNGGIPWDDIHEIFGVNKFYDAFKNFTAAEAAEKIKAWEDAQEICFRDEVKSADGKTGVVTNAEHPSYTNHACVLWKDGHASTIMKEYLTKTGRKINVDKWLAEIGGAE